MINKNWTTDLIGVMATDDYAQEDGKYSAIFINKQNSVQIGLRVISAGPHSMPKRKMFSCFASDLQRYGFEDDPRLMDRERILAVQEFLRDSLIVFKPLRKVLYDQTDVYQAKEIRLIPKSDGYTDDTRLIPVPVFSEKQHNMTYSDFEEKLIHKRYVGRIDNISSEQEDTPPFVVWYQDQKYEIIGPFTGHSYAHGGFSFQYEEKLRKIPFQKEWLQDSYEDVEDLLFVPQETFDLIQHLLPEGEIVGELEDVAVAHLPEQAQKETAAAASHVSVQEVMEPAVEEPDVEQKFLEHFIQVTREQGLLYGEKDLYNFHTSLKSSTLTILSGMSGTGKSRLVHAYAKALEADLSVIPVRPSWSDDADLIGYVDSMNMVYRPGDSGLINTLIAAEKEENKKKTYIICFDEMNLARVEHYFSQFLSVLEMESNRKQLRLYNDDLENRLYNTAQYHPVVTIGENVLFVGTVNLDESTHHFSDKVLDRANVIELDVLPYSGIRELMEERKKRVEKPVYPTATWNFADFKSKETGIALAVEELELIWQIHQTMQQANKNLGVGPRIVRQIDAYLKNLPANKQLTRAEAFDLQIKQRILTKLRGPEDQLGQLIRLGEGDGSLEGTFAEILDAHPHISAFTHTRKTLFEKAKELRANGYAV